MMPNYLRDVRCNAQLGTPFIALGNKILDLCQFMRQTPEFSAEYKGHDKRHQVGVRQFHAEKVVKA